MPGAAPTAGGKGRCTPCPHSCRNNVRARCRLRTIRRCSPGRPLPALLLLSRRREVCAAIVRRGTCAAVEASVPGGPVAPAVGHPVKCHMAGTMTRVSDIPHVQVSAADFECLVGEALDGIPAPLARAMDNVAVFVEDEPPEDGLLGLYEGVPLTERGPAYAGVLPDRITIYRQPICAGCRDAAEVVTQVRITVVHELAHHFGIGDDRLDELGWG